MADDDDQIDDPDLQNISDPPRDYTDLTRLPDEDNPMSDPYDVPKVLDDTHPTTDTNIDPTEEYDEGLSGAAEAEDPLKH
jgi:hypothetical protein